jgi:hypothetical protein
MDMYETTMGYTCSCSVENCNAYKVLARNYLGKRAIGRKEMGYEKNIKMDPAEVGCVDGAVSVSYAVAGFFITCAELLDSASSVNWLLIIITN